MYFCGRVPRLVRVVVVDEHEERLALLRHLQVLGRLGEHLRGEPVLLPLAAHGVRVVLVHDLLGVRGARAPIRVFSIFFSEAGDGGLKRSRSGP